MCARRSIFGIVVLLAIALGAVTAGTAAAEQRAYTCTSIVGPTSKYRDSHCLTETATSPHFGLTLITATGTGVQGSNAHTSAETTESTPSVLRSVVSGAEFEIECATVAGTGTLTDKVTWVEGEGFVTYKSCTVDKPAGKGCVIENTGLLPGEIVTQPLKLTTQGQSAEKVSVSPVTGTLLAKIRFTMCTIPALNITHELTGSLVEGAEGPVLNSTVAGVKTQGTLKFDGSKNTGLEGRVTVSSSAFGIGIALR